MVRYLRRRLPEVWNHLQPLRERGRRLTGGLRGAAASTWRRASAPPAVHQKSDEERLKQLVTLLNGVALIVFGGGVVTPLITLTRPAADWVPWACGFVAGALAMAGRRLLRYIPDPNARKESDHA